MTTCDAHAPATGPGDPGEYDIAAMLAATAADLADYVDDNRAGWLDLASNVRDLLDMLVITKLDAGTDWGNLLASIHARAESEPGADCDAGLYTVAADLSATAGDIAADLAEGRNCPAHLIRACRLLGTLAAALGEDTGRPPIVCLCGSTRFYDQFQQANYDLTMRGEIVLSVGFYPHAKAAHGHGEGIGHDSAAKAALDELHKRKIDLADYVLVLNVGGYIGASTRSEIAYATACGKPVRYLNSPGRAA